MRKIVLAILMTALTVSCSRVKEMSDYEAIGNLIVGERLYRSTGRTSEHSACFWEDAAIRTSWQSGGVESFVGKSSVETRHNLMMVNRCNPPLIHRSGDRAFVEYPSTTIRSVMIGGDEAILTSYMRLLYKVVKRSGEWRILELVSLNEGDQLAPVIPGTDLHINTELAKGLRPSYRWLAYSRIAAGGSESDDLPGTDRPEDVRRLYDEFNNWLSGITMEDVAILNPESGNTLRGTLYRPAGESRKPLIITSHELGSDSQRPWWVHYANHWVNEGYAVLSFDYAGGGERSRSDGLTTDMSVQTEVSDLETVLSEAKTWNFVDPKQIILVGGSQGGGVATIVAARHPKDISALVLLYPAFYLPENLRILYPDPDNFPETDKRGMLEIGRKYITNMYDYDYRADMRSYDGPVLIVHGDNDAVVNVKGSEEAVGIFPSALLHIIKGAGHVFMTEAQQEEFLKVTDEFLGK